MRKILSTAYIFFVFTSISSGGITDESKSSIVAYSMFNIMSISGFFPKPEIDIINNTIYIMNTVSFLSYCEHITMRHLGYMFFVLTTCVFMNRLSPMLLFIVHLFFLVSNFHYMWDSERFVILPLTIVLICLKINFATVLPGFHHLDFFLQHRLFIKLFKMLSSLQYDIHSFLSGFRFILFLMKQLSKVYRNEVGGNFQGEGYRLGSR